MKSILRRTALSSIVAIILLFSASATAQVGEEAHQWRDISISDSRRVAEEPRNVEFLDDLIKKSISQSVGEQDHKTVSMDTIWGTVIDCRDPRDPRMGSYNGDERVYPASVIKLCYMLTAYDQNRIGLLEMDDALREDLEKMIVPSDNPATGRVLDRIANTGFGPELKGPARESFEHKRLTAYRYMQDLGLDGLWPVNKTYGAGVPLYGREVQFLGEKKDGNYEKSNKMTTDDTARMLYLIWRHAVVDYDACEEMLELMRREEGKQRTYFSSIVPEGVTMYSKDGATSVQRHDAAIFEYPDGGTIIVVMFSNHYDVQDNNYPRVIQGAAKRLLQALEAIPGEMDNISADPDPTLQEEDSDAE